MLSLPWSEPRSNATQLQLTTPDIPPLSAKIGVSVEDLAALQSLNIAVEKKIERLVKKCKGVTSEVADLVRARRMSLVVNLDADEIEPEVMDMSVRDEGAQDDRVEFPPIIVNLAINRNIPGQLEELFLCLWGLWYSRNQFIFEQKMITPLMAIAHAFNIAGDFKYAKEQRKKGISCSEGWRAPPEGVLKLNVDGALFEDQCRYGTGVVLRDATGKVIFSASKPERGSMDPMEAELLAMLTGLQICLPLSIPSLQVESDSLLVVQEVTKVQNESFSLSGNLIQEIQFLMNRFPNIDVRHITTGTILEPMAKPLDNLDVQLDGVSSFHMPRVEAPYFDNNCVFDMDSEVVPTLDSLGMVPFDFGPNLISELYDWLALPKFTDIGWLCYFF
ncbi:unnamed protein product [Fraxinus pennsylvanica]|uniref:RNase H type-1 domain-containing protein n=1 Tax=Fraxinus pennsylvanica TaxID=56036 RepID=A0AAD2A4E5_9LAMI|nr:unnamed protein product [Fraxinus pennsylvanica]